MYFNASGITTNFDEIKAIVDDKKPAVVVLVETHLTEEINANLFAIDGYSMFNCLSHSRHTGGVTMYVRNSFQVVVQMNDKTDENWFISLKIKMFQRYFIIGGIYHSPSASDTDFLRLLENDWLSNTTDEENENIVCGDFNINYKCELESRELKRVMEAYGLGQIVSQDTRITPTSSLRIDLVFVSSDNYEAWIAPDLKVSDHETIGVRDTINIEEGEIEQQRIVKCWRRYSQRNLCSLLQQGPSEFTACDSIHARGRVYDHLLKNSVSSLIGEKVVRGNRRPMSSDLERMRRHRDELRSYHNSYKTPQNWEKYVEAGNAYSKGS